MKLLIKSFLFVSMVAVLLTYSGCKNHTPTPPSVAEVQLAKLSGDWKLTGSAANVTLDNVSKITDYAAFKLTLSGVAGADTFSYAATGQPATSPWPSSGVWEFGADPEKNILRDKGGANQLSIDYTVTDTTLELTFTYSGAGARTSQINGVWVFTFTK